jgi:hypothetical protein
VRGMVKMMVRPAVAVWREKQQEIQKRTGRKKGTADKEEGGGKEEDLTGVIPSTLF